MPWAHKLRLSDGRIAVDPLLLVDDARPNGPNEEECWKVTRKFASMCSHFGIQDAPRRRVLLAWMQVPGLAWWCTRTTVRSAQEHPNLNGTRPGPLFAERRQKNSRPSMCSKNWEKPPKGINQKHMESDRGSLNYVTQTCPALVPYLRESISLSMAGDLTAMTKVGSADARK
jgi:hypothetical protein